MGCNHGTVTLRKQNTSKAYSETLWALITNEIMPIYAAEAAAFSFRQNYSRVCEVEVTSYPRAC